MGADEFRRWYYLKAELTTFARELGLATGGSKESVADRIARALCGDEPPRGETVDTVRGGGPQLEGPVSRATVIPPGQRSSQVLREFFTAEVGPSFRFDAAMRDVVAKGAGKTLGDALDHWWASRNRDEAPIGPQFELNRFTREWWRTNPGGSRDELRAAWLAYRNQPSDLRRPS